MANSEDRIQRITGGASETAAALYPTIDIGQEAYCPFENVKVRRTGTSTYTTFPNGTKVADDIASAIATAQPLDADLTAIAGLSGMSGLLKKTGANTWALDTGSYEYDLLKSTTSNQLLNDVAQGCSGDVISGGAVTEDASNIIVSAGVIVVRNGTTGLFERYSVSGSSFAKSGVSNSTTWYIYANASGYQMTQLLSFIYSQANAPVAVITRKSDGVFSVLDATKLTRDYAYQTSVRDLDLGAIKKSGTQGICTYDTATGRFAITAGRIYFMSKPIDQAAFTAGSSFLLTRRNGGTSYVANGVTTIPYNQYDNNTTTPATVSSNKWGNWWIVRASNTIGDIYVVMGQAEYATLSDALEAGYPASRIGELGDFSTYEEMYKISIRGDGLQYKVTDLKVSAGGGSQSIAGTFVSKLGDVMSGELVLDATGKASTYRMASMQVNGISLWSLFADGTFNMYRGSISHGAAGTFDVATSLHSIGKAYFGSTETDRNALANIDDVPTQTGYQFAVNGGSPNDGIYTAVANVNGFPAYRLNGTGDYLFVAPVNTINYMFIDSTTYADGTSHFNNCKYRTVIPSESPTQVDGNGNIIPFIGVTVTPNQTGTFSYVTSGGYGINTPSIVVRNGTAGYVAVYDTDKKLISSGVSNTTLGYLDIGSSLTGLLGGKSDISGGTFTGKITTIASATGGAGLNLPHGAAPTSPVNGDIWTTSAAGLFYRVNGATKTSMDLETAQTVAGAKSFSGVSSFGNTRGVSLTGAGAVTTAGDLAHDSTLKNYIGWIGSAKAYMHATAMSTYSAGTAVTTTTETSILGATKTGGLTLGAPVAGQRYRFYAQLSVGATVANTFSVRVKMSNATISNAVTSSITPAAGSTMIIESDIVCFSATSIRISLRVSLIEDGGSVKAWRDTTTTTVTAASAAFDVTVQNSVATTSSFTVADAYLEKLN